MNWRATSNFVLRMDHDQWRTLMFVSVLFVAQILFQLHGLEHLDASDHDEHSEELCVLCILGSGLDSGFLPDIANSDFQNQSVEKSENTYSLITNFVFVAFVVRAPPLNSSIA